MTLNLTQRTSGFGTSPIIGVAHNGVDLWVATGYSGKLATSPDGITWTQRTSSFGAYHIPGIAHNGIDLWVAAGLDAKLATSSNGITWTQRTSGFGSSYITGVAHNGVDLWVAVAYDGKLATSPDGITWTQRTSSFGATHIFGIAHNGVDLWVAVGDDGKLATSPDGTNWTQRTPGFGTSDIMGVAYNGVDLWVAVGDDGKLATSPDGITWTQRTSSFGSSDLMGVAHNDSIMWVAVGRDGKLATSPDGTNWTQQDSGFGTTDIFGVANNDADLLVAVGSGGKLATGEYYTTLDITNYKTESWTVSKGIPDALWVLSAKIDRHDVPAFFETIQATADDHNGDPHTPFVGIIPTTDYMLAAAADKASLIGYDYGWYLTVQYVPSDERVTLEDTNPSDTITALLGGTAWETVTGIEPHRINTVSDWANIKKAFEFGDRCTRWKAIQEICEYCHFVFVVKWRDVAGEWQPSAYFVHEDDIDSATIGMDIPAAVTITDPDDYLMDGVSVKDSPEHQYNRVLATGYDAATDTYFYATAQTSEVAAGTEIPIEYVYADASLNTQAKTDARAQELLDFFQASAKIYVARFKRRMDLELYQKISFSGYNKIDTGEMRITQISYSRSAANDVVEIEFSKDQAIQQLRRLARAVNPDYVAGTLDMMNTDLSDIGLIDVFDYPIAGGTAASDLWEVVQSKLRPTDAALADSLAINTRGMGLYDVGSVSGRMSADFGFWGWDTENESTTEFARWQNYKTGEAIHTYLEIKKDVYINNDPAENRFPKIYFDVDSFRPTYIRGNRYTEFSGLDIIVGGTIMMNFVDSIDPSGSDYVQFTRDVRISPDLVMGGAIRGWDNNNLVFWDNATGQKTLSELAEGGLWSDASGYARLIALKDIDMQSKSIVLTKLITGGNNDPESPTFAISAKSGHDLHLYAPSGRDTILYAGGVTSIWLQPSQINLYQNVLIANGKYIKASAGDLTFWDDATGQKTLSELAAGGEGGATDHGALTGLGDYDHDQYLRKVSNCNLDMGGQDITNVEDLLVGGKIRVWEDIQMESGRRIYWPNYERIYADSSGNIHIYPAASYDTVYIHGNLHVDGSTS